MSSGLLLSLVSLVHVLSLATRIKRTTLPYFQSNLIVRCSVLHRLTVRMSMHVYAAHLTARTASLVPSAV